MQPHTYYLEKKLKKEQVVSYQTAQRMTRLLSQAIENGKSPAKLDNYTVAAKTGTSLKPKEKGGGYTNKMYTSVVGQLPASNPQIIIYVVVDSPVGEAIWGSTVAAPIFREVALQSARILNLTPDKVSAKTNITKTTRANQFGFGGYYEVGRNYKSDWAKRDKKL